MAPWHLWHPTRRQSRIDFYRPRLEVLEERTLLSFITAPTYTIASGPQSGNAIAVGDLTGNGIPDLVTANYGGTTSHTVSVLLGNGDGSFQSYTEYQVGTTPMSVALADLTGDGILDIVTANAGANTVSVLMGNGDGTFQAHHDYAAGTSPVAAAVADFNGDGVPDVAVAGSGTVRVLVGNGDGAFQAPISYGAGGQALGLAVGDFNGDGYPDLAVANGSSKNVGVLLNQGDGTFTPAITYGSGSTVNAVAVGDFNGDGVPDLVAADYGYPYGDVSVFLGKGQGERIKTCLGYHPIDKIVTITWNSPGFLNAGGGGA